MGEGRREGHECHPCRVLVYGSVGRVRPAARAGSLDLRLQSRYAVKRPRPKIVRDVGLGARGSRCPFYFNEGT